MSGFSAQSGLPRRSGELWRELEELNLAPQIALEALFVRITRELAA